MISIARDTFSSRLNFGFAGIEELSPSSNRWEPSAGPRHVRGLPPTGVGRLLASVGAVRPGSARQPLAEVDLDLLHHLERLPEPGVHLIAAVHGAAADAVQPPVTAVLVDLGAMHEDA